MIKSKQFGEKKMKRKNHDKYGPDNTPSIFTDFLIHDIDELDEEELKSITIKFSRHNKKRDPEPWELRAYKIVSHLRKERIYGKALRKMLYHELLKSVGKSMENDGIIVNGDMVTNHPMVGSRIMR